MLNLYDISNIVLPDPCKLVGSQQNIVGIHGFQALTISASRHRSKQRLSDLRDKTLALRQKREVQPGAKPDLWADRGDLLLGYGDIVACNAGYKVGYVHIYIYIYNVRNSGR